MKKQLNLMETKKQLSVVKKTYSQPTLSAYGEIRDVTLGGASPNFDSGNSSNPFSLAPGG